jgi:hypothetical protein
VNTTNSTILNCELQDSGFGKDDDSFGSQRLLGLYFSFNTNTQTWQYQYRIWAPSNKHCGFLSSQVFVDLQVLKNAIHSRVLGSLSCFWRTPIFSGVELAGVSRPPLAPTSILLLAIIRSLHCFIFVAATICSLIQSGHRGNLINITILTSV